MPLEENSTPAAFEPSESERQLLIDGLHALRTRKQDAFKVVCRDPGYRDRFSAEDFGLPQIDALIEKLSA